MNINLFNNQFKETFKCTNLILNSSTSKQYKKSLDLLNKITSADIIAAPIDDWHIAQRIVCYTQLKQVYKDIKHRYAQTNLGTQVDTPINLLENKITELKEFIKTNSRLPFRAGLIRDQYLKKVKQRLQLQDKIKVHYVESEFFNFMSDYFTEVSKPITLCYQGAYNLQGLLSWKEVLKKHIAEKSSSDAELDSSLSLIKRAIPLNVKLSFALEWLNKPSTPEQEISYFHDLASGLGTKLESTTKAGFFRKYKLSKQSIIPSFVIINEIVWDILSSINEMKVKEENILLLGTSVHCVVVQLICRERASSTNEGKYDYQIINTGEGVYVYHVSDGKKAYPVVYEDLPKKSITYSFIEKLLTICLKSDNIDEFYDLHKQHLPEDKKNQRKAPMYNLQIQETCVYKSIEETLHCKLDEAKFHELENTKIKIATNKLEQAIKIIKKNKNVLEDRIKNSKKRKSDALAYLPPTKRLKYDHELLNKAKKYQKNLHVSSPPSNII